MFKVERVHYSSTWCEGMVDLLKKVRVGQLSGRLVQPHPEMNVTMVTYTDYKAQHSQACDSLAQAFPSSQQVPIRQKYPLHVVAGVRNYS